MPKMQVSLAEAKIIRHLRRARVEAQRAGIDVSQEDLAGALAELAADPDRAVAAIGASEEATRADTEAETAAREADEAAATAAAASDRAREAQETAARRRRDADAALGPQGIERAEEEPANPLLPAGIHGVLAAPGAAE